MFKQVNKSQHTPTNQVELKENILFRMYSAGYMAKQKQTELVNTYQITNADYQNNCKKLKEKLYKGGITDQEEIEKTVKFLVRHPSPDTLSLEMLAEYGKLDINQYLSDIIKYTQLSSSFKHTGDSQVYNVTQREFAVVSNGTKIGTTNIQQCVAVIIKGNDSTALAHFDRYTTTESLKKNIQQIFPQERSLDVRIYGAKDLVQKEISSNNMSAVLTTLYNLSENGYNINIISINTNLKLADVKTPILEAKWSDIVFDGQEIHEGDVLGDTTYCLRDVIRREFDSERNYKYEISENIIREADFYIFNINNYADIQKFIEDNGYYDFHISEQKLHQKLFNFLNYHNREYKFVFLHIGEFMMSYYQVYLITSLKEGLEQNPEMYVEHGLIADHNHSLGVTSQAEYKDVVAVSNSVMGSEYENNARSTSTSNAQNDKTDSKNSSSSLADSTISHAYKYLTTEVVGIGEFVEINDTTWEA